MKTKTLYTLKFITYCLAQLSLIRWVYIHKPFDNWVNWPVIIFLFIGALEHYANAKKHMQPNQGSDPEVENQKGQ